MIFQDLELCIAHQKNFSYAMIMLN